MFTKYTFIQVVLKLEQHKSSLHKLLATIDSYCHNIHVVAVWDWLNRKFRNIDSEDLVTDFRMVSVNK